MAKIFISYSSKNKDIVRQLATDLKEIGHEPWLDEWEIKVGDCIITKIEKGVSDSDYVALALTPQSVSSGWVEREWKTAYWSEIEQKRIVVLPILLTNCEVPTLLKTKRYADFRNNYTVGFAQLIQSITPIPHPEQVAPLVKTTKTNVVETIKLVSRFAGNASGMSLSPSAAKEFTDWWMEDCADRDLDEFKEVYKYAFSGNGMNLSHNSALNLGKLWMTNYPGKDFAKFKEIFRHAYSINGMGLSTNKAMQFALDMIAKT